MELDEQQLRLEGIYRQNDRGEYMQRVKLPGGILSLAQASALADLGQRYGSQVLHLTTRGSIEFHNLQGSDLPEIHRRLAAVGLFSRGACGGAVRGISCSSSFGPGYARMQVVLRHFLRYFSGNPNFEGLPKKFKFAFEAGYERSRHLIQDLALVLVEEQDGEALYDVWIAGGLGREPQAGFLLADRVNERELLPCAEAVIRVYKSWGEKGRRLKHLLNQVGEAELRQRISDARKLVPDQYFNDAFPKALLPDEQSRRIRLEIFAGQLPAKRLADLCELADNAGIAWLLVTPDQDIELVLGGQDDEIEGHLVQAGFELSDQAGALRVCPGNHECRMGLSATREVAQRLREEFGEHLDTRSIAISGCANSCAQPQLAEFGIIASKLQRDGEQRIPLYDLYRRQGDGLGRKIHSQLDLEALIEQLGRLLEE